MSTTSLLKALTEAGIGSRRRMADAIKNSRVKVNGEVITDFRYSINIDTDSVSISGHGVDLKPSSSIYLMLNKPKGLLSTTSDERGRRTVLDIIPEKYRRFRLYPAGRLDKDSTGLLILTNDGDFTYQLTHPRFEHEKEYLVKIAGCLQKEEIKELERGVVLGEKTTYPSKVRESKITPFNYSIAIHEGRKRQVRMMLENLGHKVLELRRIRVGSLRLGDLKEGQVLGQARSTQRLRPLVSGSEARLVARIVELATRYGRYGYRRIDYLAIGALCYSHYPGRGVKYTIKRRTE